MVRADLDAFLRRLSAYLERAKPPAEMTVSLWIEECGRIPTECLAWIEKTALKELEYFPKNFPKWLWFQYHQWLDSHPEKKARVEKLGCPNCHEGWITVSKFDKRVGYSGDVLFRCANCNGGEGAIPARTKHQLLGAGYCKPVYRPVRPCHAAFNDPPKDEKCLPVWEDKHPIVYPELMPLVVGEIIQEMQEVGE